MAESYSARLRVSRQPRLKLREQRDKHIRLQGGTPVAIKVISPQEYDGNYNVTPMTYEEQTLKTKDKLLHKDIRIQKIPKFNVSNTAGGMTLIIGEEYYK